jgi:perosamine synthetase
VKAMIPVNEPLLDGNEKKYLAQCIDDGWISSEGPFVQRFEAQMAELTERQYGVAMANGSLALDAALAALSLGEDFEVILPSFTIISCAAAIVRAGGRPIPVDCDAGTWNMDIFHVTSALTSKTRAIMIVHIYGLPVDADPILEFANAHGLKVIEDAAELIGQTYKGRPCGSLGDVSVFSFYPNKHVTTGEGGMALTNDPYLAERLRSLRNLCMQPARRFIHEELGWNFRMSNLQAAVGVAQLERLSEFVTRKRKMGERYSKLLGSNPHLQLPLPETSYAKNVYWVFGVVLKESAQMDASEAARRLSEQNIGTRPFFWPMHEQPVFNKMGWYLGLKLPVAERIARQGFYIPSGLSLTDTQIDRVAEAVHQVVA